jgi:hypothetical protein
MGFTAHEQLSAAVTNAGGLCPIGSSGDGLCVDCGVSFTDYPLRCEDLGQVDDFVVCGRFSAR